MNIVQLKNCNFCVRRGRFDAAKKEDGCDFLVYGFDAFPEVELTHEIEGSTDVLASLAAYSHRESTTVFCGLVTKALGYKHLSVVVCDKGRLIDIVDRTLKEDDGFESGSKIKIFATQKGRVAVLVDSDVTSPRLFEKVVDHCDVVLSISKTNSEQCLTVGGILAARYDVPCLFVTAEEIDFYIGKK